MLIFYIFPHNATRSLYVKEDSEDYRRNNRQRPKFVGYA